MKQCPECGVNKEATLASIKRLQDENKLLRIALIKAEERAEYAWRNVQILEKCRRESEAKHGKQ